MEEIFSISLLVLISMLIGSVGTLVGFGGGIFMVPILVSVFHYPLALAVGSVMLGLVPSSIVSTVLSSRAGNVDFKMGILLEIPTILGVLLGSSLLTWIPANQAEWVFSILIFVLGVSFLLRKKQKKRDSKSVFDSWNQIPPKFLVKGREKGVMYPVSVWMLAFFGMAAGILAGLFGIGGGFLKTPIMIRVFKIPARISAATALFMIVITSITGSASHYLQGHMTLSNSWPVALGFTLGALLGRKLDLKMPEATLEKLIGLSLVLAALVMVA